MHYVGYLVIASDQKFLVARGEDGDVTELMIPARNLMMLKDRRGGLRDLRGLPRDASDQKFLIESGKDGDVTELMTPVRTLLRLEDRRSQSGGVAEPTETRDHSRAIQVRPVTLPGASPSV